jgi:hypothetical protein
MPAGKNCSQIQLLDRAAAAAPRFRPAIWRNSALPAIEALAGLRRHP